MRSHLVNIKSIAQNNFSVKKYKENQKPAFGAGMKADFMLGMLKADTAEISKKMAQKGILSDFGGNKVVAWCCDKTVDIFEQLNEKYNLKLPQPKGIFVEDFAKLKIDKKDEGLYGFCNCFPFDIYHNSSFVVPEKTLFFNSFETQKHKIPDGEKWRYDWKFINDITDKEFAVGHSSSDHFMFMFLHEFAHSAHLNYLFKKFDYESLFWKFKLMDTKVEKASFKNKYGKQISKLGSNALENPIETTASDIPVRIIDSLDKDTLKPVKNPFKESPYVDKSIFEKLGLKHNKQKEEILLDEILRNFWNGKFE